MFCYNICREWENVRAAIGKLFNYTFILLTGYMKICTIIINNNSFFSNIVLCDFQSQCLVSDVPYVKLSMT